MCIKNLLRVSALIALLWVSSVFAEEASDGPKSDQENAKTEPTPNSSVSTPAAEKPTPLNPALKPNQPDDMIPSVYKDMVVVQRKAKQKAGRFLFVPSITLDFSDGPITSYAVNTDIGYALSDFWEVYANVVPTFITVERPIVSKVRELGTLANGQQASITYAKPISQYGAELLWAPAYGKESWGPYSIIRSDTFFKMGIADVNFAGGTSGMRYSLMVGKTYFISRWFNFRGEAGVAYMQSIVDEQKSGDWAPVIDLGTVYYF